MIAPSPGGVPRSNAHPKSIRTIDPPSPVDKIVKLDGGDEVPDETEAGRRVGTRVTLGGTEGVELPSPEVGEGGVVADQAKGRVKEAAGVLTGDKKMKREEKADQAAGKLKQAVGKARKKVAKVTDDVKDALE
jgi:uncharacterized protein YjbJ (UPF0337 family)